MDEPADDIKSIASEMEEDQKLPEPIPAGLDEKGPNQDAHADGGGVEDKKQAILHACRTRDLARLRALAESPGGFLSDDLRQQAWPVLLGLPPFGTDVKAEDDGRDGHNGYSSTTSSAFSWESLPRHKDEDQVQLDVNRAFVYYPKNQTDSQRQHQKSLLSDLILSVLRRHPYLHYFQGYHDIAQVLLLVLNPPISTPNTSLPQTSILLSHLSLLHIRDFMLPSMTPSLAQLHLIPDILRHADPLLYRLLSLTEPFFALAGTLTMYAHEVPTFSEITRLFDVLLARDPCFTAYLFASLILARRDELLSVEPDRDILHAVLSRLPDPLPVPIETLIANAAALERKYPPETLPSWKKRVSKWSVLKTARRKPGMEGIPPGSIEDAQQYFEKQVRELEWLEKRDRARKWVWQHRRSVGMAGMAVVVAVLAVLLRRAGENVPSGTWASVYLGYPGVLPGSVAEGMAWLSGVLRGLWP